jgi:tetratricopeptide (TPR) repeat protein
LLKLRSKFSLKFRSLSVSSFSENSGRFPFPFSQFFSFSQKSITIKSKNLLSLLSYLEAESVLCQNKSPKTLKDLEDICREFGELSGFVMQLLSKICKHTERSSMANECCRASLKHNPFLWSAYVDLCNRGERPNPREIFQITNDELLCQLERQLWNNSDGSGEMCCEEMTETPMRMSMTALAPSALTQITDKPFKYLQSNLSPVTPSFGVLPLTNSPLDSLKQTMLFLTPSPPLDASKKVRGHLATPLQQTKPVVLNQSSNITPNRQQTDQQVRRSSRIFSNYSVKENNKSPFAQPRSPPRKASKRVGKSAKATLNGKKIDFFERNLMKNSKFHFFLELNEKNKERSETITSQTAGEDIAAMKRASAGGLMQLLQELGQVYQHVQHYEMDEALDVLESKLPAHHFTSSWVQSVIALIHHERREYDEAVKIFAAVHKSEPYRLQHMEIYSTDLWHLQKDAMLSMLAQDLMAHDKTSAVTWCVAGNCFSALKEHDTAIKFFNRAIQMDPDFPYSYTLLGHELVVTEELEKALGCYRKAILKDSRHYNAWFGIGTIYSKQERFQLAEVHYRHALKINRKNSVILVHIGVMQFYLHKPDQAIQTLTEAIRLEPKNPLCKFHRASMNFSIGKLQEALAELEELKQIVPKESVVYYLIGKIHKQLGNIDLALMHFSWATDLGELNLPRIPSILLIFFHSQIPKAPTIRLKTSSTPSSDLTSSQNSPKGFHCAKTSRTTMKLQMMMATIRRPTTMITTIVAEHLRSLRLA